MSENATLFAAINSQGAAAGAAAFNAATRSMTAGARAVDNAVERTRAGLGQLRTALAAIGAGAVIKGVVEAGDSFTSLRGRLEALLGSSTAAQSAMDGVAAAALRARTPATELASSFARINMAAGELNLPLSDTITLTETLAKAVKVSGATGAEAAAGMQQLAQAIASGRFQGDEFRSVAENLPFVMKVLQEQTGKTAGELRKLAEQGKITGDTLVSALLNAQDDINAKFAKLPDTAGSAFALLGGEVERLTGSLAEQSGVSQAWADVFDQVRASLKDPQVVDGLRAMTDAVAFFGRSIADNIPAAVETLRGVGSVVSDVTAFFRDFVGSFVDFGAAVAELTGLDRAVSSVADTVREQFNKDVAAARDRLGEAAAATDTFKASADDLNGTLSGISAVAAKAIEASDALKSLGQGGARANKRDITFGSGTSSDAGAKRAERETRALQEAVEITRLQNELTEAKLANDQNVVIAIETEIEKRRAVTAELQRAHPELARQLQEETLIGLEAARTLERMEDLRATGEQFGSVLADGLRGITLEGQSLQSTLGNVVKRLADMVFQLTVAEPLAKGLGQALSGSSSFGSFFSSGAQQAASGDIASGLGSFLSSAGSFLGFANGGVFDKPVALSGAGGFRGVMAEAGPEAIVPLARGADGALGVRVNGGGSGGSQNIFYINGDVSDDTITKLRALVQTELGGSAPRIVRDAVSAVQREHRTNPRFLSR